MNTNRHQCKQASGWWRRLTFILCLWTTLLSISRAVAHDPGLSTARVRITADKLEADVAYSAADVQPIKALDPDRDGKISPIELDDVARQLRQTNFQVLEIRFDSQPAQLTDASCRIDENNDVNIHLVFQRPPAKELYVRSTWLSLLPVGHRQFLSVQGSDGKMIGHDLLSAYADSMTMPLAETVPPENVSGVRTFAGFLVMGVKHIWMGYDHLLFLFSLLLVIRTFGASVKIITCFTIAHSITLAIATLSVVQISSRIVEPLIAASIVYVAIENLVRGDNPKGRSLLTFAFGLIHGFGFASVLRALGVGANGSGIAIPLVSFNLGVELGQIVVAACILPLIWTLQTKPSFVKRWVPAASVLVALLGGYWFVQRVWF